MGLNSNLFSSLAIELQLAIALASLHICPSKTTIPRLGAADPHHWLYLIHCLANPLKMPPLVSAPFETLNPGLLMIDSSPGLSLSLSYQPPAWKCRCWLCCPSSCC